MRREVEAVREREVHERRVQPLVAQLAAEVPQVRARRAAKHLGPRVGHHLKETGLFKQVIYSFLVLNIFITSKNKHCGEVATSDLDVLSGDIRSSHWDALKSLCCLL